MQVNMHEAKSQLSKLGRLVWEGEEVVICRHGKPYLRLTPYHPASRVPGLWRGRVWIAPDFDETPSEVVEAFEGDEDAGGM